MKGIAEVAALITVVGAAIYGLGLLGVAWSIHKRWKTHNEGVVYFFDEQHRLTSMPDSKIASVRVRKE